MVRPDGPGFTDEELRWAIGFLLVVCLFCLVLGVVLYGTEARVIGKAFLWMALLALAALVVLVVLF